MSKYIIFYKTKIQNVLNRVFPKSIPLQRKTSITHLVYSYYIIKYILENKRIIQGFIENDDNQKQIMKSLINKKTS